ncbi:AMP-binding protein [Flagellimonas sp. HMM57]|uniref:AMP-binding protein n=1 Tax=unclassified Flagellimonas TaxID=2644544 RepID=UPI0013D56ACB|nr:MULTISPECIES: AMP-binding protein [unclassified Flagellimonas]UII76148.1 AMP-binding protein [Flagellimonas sp. HMM57]
MKFLQVLKNSIENYPSRNAFFIESSNYSYSELGHFISKIRGQIQNNIPLSEKLIGMVTNNDIETYATILALWMEGKAYVPINPIYPKARNKEILGLTDSRYVLDSSSSPYLDDTFNIVPTNNDEPCENNLEFKDVNPNDIAYVIFTSGSTGVPKGAPVAFSNLNSFTNAIETHLSFSLSPSDRCLQMFELTFDMSVVSFLAPLLHGACVYTLPKSGIKYFQIIKLLAEHKLTVLIMVPSIIHYLRPYFKEIQGDSVRYSCFAGGKLYDEIAGEWNSCIPNAQIINYYGPTETTIYCGGYLFEKNGQNKHENGILSIGKPFGNTIYLVADGNGKELKTGETGELCIAGEQLFPGYLKNEEKNSRVFFSSTYEGSSHLFYKSGDLCYKDENGDYMYVGRSDFQVKIRGYRVELGEVEYHVKKKLLGTDVVVIDITDGMGNTELGLAICSKELDLKPMLSYLKETLPPYMVPTQFLYVEQFPHSVNDKIDMKELRSLFNNSKQKK